jgi:hypothetical protein
MASVLFSMAAANKHRAPHKKERHYMTVIMLYIQQTDGWLRKYVSFIRPRQKWGAIKSGASA